MAEAVAANGTWQHDVQTVTTTVLTTTGGTLWSAATRLCQYLKSEAAVVGLQRPGVKVLELGAGCGTLGLTVARNIPTAAEVCLTEQAYGGALAHLQRNVAANAHLPNMVSVTCCACDWTHFNDPSVLQAATAAAAAGRAVSSTHTLQDPPDKQQQHQQEHQHQAQQQQAGACYEAGQPTSSVTQQELLDLHKLVSTPWDVIIGSDLIYNKDGAHALPRVLATLMQARPQQEPHEQLVHGTGCCQHTGFCHPAQQGQQGAQQDSFPASSRLVVGRRCRHPVGPVMYYAHTKHRYDNMDVMLLEWLEAEGLTVEEVIEAGCELAPPSPPPFSSLFPDMRCAVFKIYRAS